MIEAKFWNLSISLKEIKDLWFEAKEIITDNNANLDNNDIEVSINIFNKGIEKVGEFFIKWQERKISPTDKELDLLEEAFNEASWAFNFLDTNAPNAFDPGDNNEKWQNKIKENKRVVSEEKDRRKQLKNLQSQLNSLWSQPNNGDSEAKIRDLQRQINELKGKKDIPQKPNQEEKKVDNKESGSKTPWNIIIPVGLIIVLLGLIIIIYKKSQSK